MFPEVGALGRLRQRRAVFGRAVQQLARRRQDATGRNLFHLVGQLDGFADLEICEAEAAGEGNVMVDAGDAVAGDGGAKGYQFPVTGSELVHGYSPVVAVDVGPDGTLLFLDGHGMPRDTAPAISPETREDPGCIGNGIGSAPALTGQPDRLDTGVLPQM
jgi:hypothetical protein